MAWNTAQTCKLYYFCQPQPVPFDDVSQCRKPVSNVLLRSLLGILMLPIDYMITPVIYEFLIVHNVKIQSKSTAFDQIQSKSVDDLVEEKHMSVIIPQTL
jgi:hypothetical protein